jgi:hypothetical protein
MKRGEETFEKWLRSRVPPIPDPFLSLLLEAPGGWHDGGETGALGLFCLSRALGLPGRNREAAFYLLAADAFLTYACEEAARRPDPAESMRALLTRIGEVFK